MNKIILILLIPIWISSCANELDAIYPYPPTPIVYGILSPLDTIHKVVVMKSFICKDSIEYHAKISDSLYFLDADVSLEIRNPEGRVIQHLPLEKQLISNKLPGFFSSGSNIIYTCNPNDIIKPAIELRYSLCVNFPSIDESVYAETIVPPAPGFLLPTTNRPRSLNLNTLNTIEFLWKRSIDYFMEFATYFEFEELISGAWVSKTIVNKKMWNRWEYSSLMRNGEYENFNLLGDWFYDLVAGRIKPSSIVEARRFVSIRFELLAADETFYDYFASIHYLDDYNEAALDNIVNGKGLFIGYNKTVYSGYGLTSGSLDSLALGEKTRHLKFLRWH